MTLAHATWLDVAMKQIKIAELKDHLSEHLRAVEGGLEVEVTDRKRPIARLVPISPPSATVVVPASRPFREVREKRYRPARWAMASGDLLREERGKR